MNITVYLGSRNGNDPVYCLEAKKLGEWIAKNGHTLIYGGSHCGTMDSLRNACLHENGHVVGVMPKFFVDQNRHADNLSELQIVETMQERIAVMLEQGDVFVGLPGGLGTLEEVFITVSAIALNHKDADLYLVNTNGFFDGLQQEIEHMKKAGFIDSDFDRLHFVDNVDALLTTIEATY